MDSRGGDAVRLALRRRLLQFILDDADTPGVSPNLTHWRRAPVMKSVFGMRSA